MTVNFFLSHENMGKRLREKISTPSTTLGEWHIIDRACFKRKWFTVVYSAVKFSHYGTVYSEVKWAEYILATVSGGMGGHSIQCVVFSVWCAVCDVQCEVWNV